MSAAWQLPQKLTQIVVIALLISTIGFGHDSKYGQSQSTQASLKMLTDEDPFSEGLPLPTQPDWDLLKMASDSDKSSSKEDSRYGIDALLQSFNCTQDTLSSNGEEKAIDHDLLTILSMNRAVNRLDYEQDHRIASRSFVDEPGLNMIYIKDKDDLEGISALIEVNRDEVLSSLNALSGDSVSQKMDRIADTNSKSEGADPHFFYEIKPQFPDWNPALDISQEFDSDVIYFPEIKDPTPNFTRTETDTAPLRHAIDSLLKSPSYREDVKKYPKTITEANLEALARNDINSGELLSEADTGRINWTEGKTGTSGEKRLSKRDYAVVVGINSYADRTNLHTCVNDADTMAALFESYGFNVVKLTDQTAEKPTKHNILDKALGELKRKKNPGKIFFYFSGHGEKNGNDYYLIPRDGNGQPSNYISAMDLRRSIEGMKNIVLIVDACNSGELESIIDTGQMMLASSDNNQSSNEMWFGPLSLFTHSLCNAIREEKQQSKTIILEKCFNKAREETKRYSSQMLLSQTPQIEDRSGGNFSLD